MRITSALFAAAVTASACAAGCVTTTTPIKGLIMPGVPVPNDPENTSEAKQERAREWIAQLTMEGVRPENQAARTVFLIKRLVNYMPFSTEVVLVEGVGHEHPKVRENCAFVLGYANSRDAEEALIGMLDDSRESVRLSAAGSLVIGYANRAGVPPLMRALYHDRFHFRREAIKNLQVFTQQYFGYRAEAPLGEREFAASRWEDWWRLNGATYVPPVLGRPSRR